MITSNSETQDILSPALSQPSLALPEPKNNIWSAWSKVYHTTKKYGPFRVPVDKIFLTKLSRTHTFSDILDLSEAIQNDDQRSIYPVLVEIDSYLLAFLDLDDRLRKLAPLADLPMDILNINATIGFLIHGVKRCQAVQLIKGENYVYTYLLPPGET
jgi:hypothetical protein